jgi:hypothetical protein
VQIAYCLRRRHRVGHAKSKCRAHTRFQRQLREAVWRP